MNIITPFFRRRRGYSRGAFTITELYVTVGVFALLIGGVMFAFINGLYMFQSAKNRLQANDEARKALIRFTDDVRSANRISVGNCSLTNFTEVATNSAQIGNAVQINPDTNYTANWVRYFFDTNTSSSTYSEFCQMVVSNGYSNQWVLVHSLTNAHPIFASEDSWGNVLTNNLNNRVIAVTLQFNDLRYMGSTTGTGTLYQGYQLHTRVTRRVFY